MGSSSFFFLFFSSSLLPYLCISGPISNQTIEPPFTASHFQFIDQSGAFLISSNGKFQAFISDFKEENSQNYFFIVHVESDSIVWTANRNHPISDSDKLYLSTNGLVISRTDNSGTTTVVWSTPTLSSSSQVSVMELQDSGNLVLLDRNNVSLWETFDHPTDTVVMGQSLAVGTSLDCDKSGNDWAVGDYRLVVTGADAVLQWKGMSYWKLSMEPKGSQDSNSPASFLALNGAGLFLLGSDRSTVVIKISLGPADFRLAKIESDGKFSVRRFVDKNWVEEFRSPSDDCQIPFICNKMGLCTSGRCLCPPNFHGDPFSKGGCTPTDASLALPSGCNNRTKLNSSVLYVKLDFRMDYFANGFMAPAKQDLSLLACQDLCTRNCSCLGIFYGNSSGSCYVLENPLGSIMAASNSNRDRLGYIKTIVVSSRADPDANTKKIPIVGLVLFPSSGILLIIIVALGFHFWRRNRLSRTAKKKSGHGDSYSSELQIISIPGLPVRFSYEDLVAATENFRTQVGSGGFGTVYKGTLPDKTIVAVKKITNVVRGRKNSTVQTQSQSMENDSSEGNGTSSASSGWEPRPTYFPLLALEMHLKGRYLELADSKLERRLTNEEVEKLVKVALCCLHEDPMLRPAMTNVVDMLEGLTPLTEPRQESLNFLRFYGRRFSEASRIEGSNEQNEFVLFPPANLTSGTGSSYNSMSYMSAQHLSGPR
ncbi:unnamed protein product [Dovyalis caffra]|uniref:Bulb-type lectin domain-containing protein n=1 Tax=Dovyalis caffra TaxID=77055 RepID=A0AAV1RZB1_9ROSI|nr:unnamed protein product [Dovyalis caffra]